MEHVSDGRCASCLRTDVAQLMVFSGVSLAMKCDVLLSPAAFFWTGLFCVELVRFARHETSPRHLPESFCGFRHRGYVQPERKGWPLFLHRLFGARGACSLRWV